MVGADGLICIRVVPREPLSVGVAHPALYISNQFRQLRHVENC